MVIEGKSVDFLYKKFFLYQPDVKNQIFYIPLQTNPY